MAEVEWHRTLATGKVCDSREFYSGMCNGLVLAIKLKERIESWQNEQPKKI